MTARNAPYWLRDAFDVTAAPRAALGYAGEIGFAFPDIEVVVAHHERPGDYAEMDVVAVLRLDDGRYALLRAWCDTTGWDCQAGGDIEVAACLSDLRTLAMTADDRQRLGASALAEGDA